MLRLVGLEDVNVCQIFVGGRKGCWEAVEFFLKDSILAVEFGFADFLHLFFPCSFYSTAKILAVNLNSLTIERLCS